MFNGKKLKKIREDLDRVMVVLKVVCDHFGVRVDLGRGAVELPELKEKVKGISV